MGFSFVPDYYFDTFDLASAEFLLSLGIRGIILDVDNTLEPYENPHPGEHVKKWLSELSSSGIRAAIVSNNNSDRINEFNKELGLFAISKAKKPLRGNIKRAMAELGTDKNSTAIMGDQIFTDILAGKRCGLAATILVPPIKDKRDFFTRFKRWLERPILKKYRKREEKRNK